MSSIDIIDVEPLEDYKILLTFETGEKRLFDVTPYIFGDWFGQLKDKNYFKTVRAVGHTVEWQDGQDIAPHELYKYSTSLL